jgi:tetratricopeptide (TPR) repeat protein
VLRFARPDTKATLENEAASWFYRRLLNTDGAVVADWNDADAQCLLYMVKYGLLYANIIERNRTSNPNVNIVTHYQSLERMLRIGLANYQQATPEWRATVDLMLLYVLAAQGRMNDAAQILQTMQQWSMAALMAALDRLQQLADISPATNRHVLGEMRLNIVQMIEQPLETPQQNAGAPINHHRLDVIRADALADTGRSQEAVDLLGQRLRQSPDDMELLVSLARILERQPDVQSQELSLKLWRSIEQRSWKHSETWWNAREATLRLLIVTGQRQEAESTFQMLQILNPELGGADRKLRLESLFPPEP